jgi:hypothetical protein
MTRSRKAREAGPLTKITVDGASLTSADTSPDRPAALSWGAI